MQKASGEELQFSHFQVFGGGGDAVELIFRYFHTSHRHNHLALFQPGKHLHNMRIGRAGGNLTFARHPVLVDENAAMNFLWAVLIIVERYLRPATRRAVGDEGIECKMTQLEIDLDEILLRRRDRVDDTIDQSK